MVSLIDDVERAPPQAQKMASSAGLQPATRTKSSSFQFQDPAGRRLAWGPLCGPQMAPGLKKALFGTDCRAGFPCSGHALLSLLDAGSSGLREVLAALGSSPELLRLVASERLRYASGGAS